MATGVFRESIPLIKKVDDLTKHSMVMVAFGTLAGFFTYLYQLSMGLILSPEQYGILFSLTSLLVIIQVFSQTVTIAVAKFASRLKSESRLGDIGYLWKSSLKKISFISTGFFVVALIVSPFLGRFLKLDNPFYPMILFSAVVIALWFAVNCGIMQGLQKFISLGFSQSMTGLLRVLFGVLFVLVGWGVYGGLAAIPISYILVFLLTFWLMRDLSRNRSEPFAMSGASSYAGLTMMAVLSFTMLTNVDAFLARHYLNASDAGNYSALSVLGRVAFYAPSGVAAALFPKASEMFVNGGNHRRILVKALVLTLVIAAGVVLVYGAAPQRISQFLFDERYILIAPYLVKYAASMALSAVSFLLMNYFLSVNKEKIAYALLGIAVFQITLLVLFHASIAQLVDIMLVSGALSIIALVPFVFLGKEKRREGKTGGIGFNPGKSVTEQKIK